MRLVIGLIMALASMTPALLRAQPVDARNPVFKGPGGIVAGSPTGGNLGPGTINSQGVYVNGVAVGGGLTVPNACVIGGTGTALSGVTLGTNLSCTGSTLNATGGGGTPGGSNGQVQINQSGTFGGVPVGTSGNNTVLQTNGSGVVAPAVLPTATPSQLGAVRPDGSTITISNGILSATTGGGGTVTSTALQPANGFTGTVANPNTTPTITLSTTASGILKGSAGAISSATPGSDYLTPNGSGTGLSGILPLAGGTLSGSLNSAGINDVVGVNVTPPATVTSLTTNISTTAAGTILPVANATGLQLGQVASGTNIPDSDPVVFVSGGTAPVVVTASFGAGTGTTLVPVSDSTGLFAGMLARDTTTPSVWAANTRVVGIAASASAVVTVTGTAGAAGQSNVTVSSGGASCLQGMIITDATAAVIPANTQVATSTATTISLTANITGGGIGATDTIRCYPTVITNGMTAVALTVGDSLSFSPAFQLLIPTTAAVTSGTVVTFSSPLTAVGASVSSTGTVGAGYDGFYQNGIRALQITTDGTTEHTCAGYFACGSIRPDALYVTAIGSHALEKNVMFSPESSAFGAGALHSVTTGTQNNAFGINALGFNVFGSGNTAIGTDAMRNTVNPNGAVAIGMATLQNDNNTMDIGIGNNVLSGNVNSTGFYNIGIGDSVLRSPAITSARQNIAIGINAMSSLTMTNASDNICVGTGCGDSMTTAQQNVVLGTASGGALTTGSGNVILGYQAGFASTADNQNVLVGGGSGFHINGGSNNACLGFQACNGVSTGGSNVVLGARTSTQNEITTGTHNVSIGPNAQVPVATNSNQLDIMNFIYGLNLASTGATVSAGRIGIGTTAPTAALTLGDAGWDGTAQHDDGHLGVVQTVTLPTTTNGTLDSHASDVTGTITLSAANPVVTFGHAWATAPHCVLSSPSGGVTLTSYAVATGTLTITTVATTGTVTYMCIQ